MSLISSGPSVAGPVINAVTGSAYFGQALGGQTLAVMRNGAVVANTVADATGFWTYTFGDQPGSGDVIAVAPAGLGSNTVSWKSSTMLGVNISGLENNPYVVPPPNSQVDYFWSKGFRLLREGFDWVQLQPTLNGDFEPNYLAKLDAAVAYATGVGFTLVIDAHNYGQYNGKLIGSADVPVAAFVNLWTRLATRYQSNRRVVFGLMNEPDPRIGYTTWIGAVNAAIVGIRSVDATSPHVIAAPFLGSECPRNPLSAAVTFLTQIVDVARKTVFEFHQYFDSDTSGRSATVLSPTMSVEVLTHVTARAKALGKQLFYGEWGAGNNPDGLALVANTLAFIQEHNDTFWGVTWWGGGDFGSVLDNNGYYFGIQASSTGQDTPFTLIHQSFMPGGSRYNAQGAVNGCNLAIASGTVFATSGGAFGKGGLVPGSNSYAYNSAGNNPQFNTLFWGNQYTLEAWFRKINKPASGKYACIFGGQSGNILIGDNGLITGTSANATGSALHFIRWSTGPNGTRIYLDGALVFTGTTMPSEPAETVMYMGSLLGQTGQDPLDLICSVALFCVESTSGTPPAAPYTGKEANLIAYWPLLTDGNTVNISPANVLADRAF